MRVDVLIMMYIGSLLIAISTLFITPAYDPNKHVTICVDSKLYYEDKRVPMDQYLMFDKNGETISCQMTK